MRILCFGDSNTYGYDPRGFFGGRYDAGDRWVELLGKLSGHTVINAGVNGRDIPRTVPALPDHDLLLVMLGTNDLLQGAHAAEAADRMERFLTGLLPRSILLIAPPPMKPGAWVSGGTLIEESIRLVDHYRSLAQRLRIPFLDTRDWEIGMTFDGVHFTEAGHHAFARRLRAELNSLLTLP